MVHLIKYASQVFCGVYEASTARLKRAPLKNGNIAKMLLVALRGGLEIKNRLVLKNSGNLLSNEHKNFIICLRNG